MKVAIILMAVVVFALACGQPSHFVPGKSPTVTPSYNPQGTPSVPVVVSPDLPEGWRWAYSNEFPSQGDDNWLLLDEESVIAGFIFNTGADCWFLIGDGSPEPPCIDRDEVGKRAAEALVARHQSRPEPTAAVAPTATIEPKTPLEAFKIAFEPENASDDHQVRQLDDGSFRWVASVFGSSIYQITDCPPEKSAPPAGACVRAQLENTTKYPMADVEIICDGRGDAKTSPIRLSAPVQPGHSTSWLWVRSPIVDPYSCEITWTAGP